MLKLSSAFCGRLTGKMCAAWYIGIAAIALSVAGCGATATNPPANFMLSEDVQIEKLTPGVWRHISFHTFPSTGPFPSNGLIVRSNKGAILIDTAWNPQQTARILDWTEENVGPIEALFVSHAHVDRLGGLAEVHGRGIPSFALVATVQLSATAEGPAIQHGVESGYRFDRYGLDGEFYFPGAGHAPDNAVVYLAASRILAGTCMVRALDTQTLGNTSDADLASWPVVIQTLQDRYPNVELVVPGHGAPGGPELLAHTLNLLRDKGE